MRTLILFVISFFFVGNVHGQTRILKDINFHKGNWRLVGIALGEKPNSLEDSVGDFIITDKHDLKEIKKRWKLKRVVEDINSVGGNYKLLFVNNKNEEIRYDLNFEKKYLSEYEEGGRGYEFPPELFYTSFKHLKRISRTTFLADSLEIAKRLRDTLSLIDSVYFFYDNDAFYKYDGSMLIELPVGEYLPDKFDIPEPIRIKYPNEKFNIHYVSPHIYRIECNKIIAQSLKSNKVKEEWHEFSSIGFFIYGLNETQLNKIIQSIK